MKSRESSISEASTLVAPRKSGVHDPADQPGTRGGAEGDPGRPGLSAGTMVDHFRVMRPLGRGGMGEVYLARDTRLGRKVALKLIHRGLARSRTEVERFVEEARSTARFNHPHIVTIHAVGEFGEQPYVALEYLAGSNLRDRLNERPLSLAESLRIGLSIAEALRHAHEHELLHRDLKPENVMLPTDGRLRVVDFGLATATHKEPDIEPSDPSTATHSLNSWPAGTPDYMAPEQWAQKPLTPAVDVWALGLILFEIIADEAPYPLDRRIDQIMDDAFSATPLTATRDQRAYPGRRRGPRGVMSGQGSNTAPKRG